MDILIRWLERGTAVFLFLVAQNGIAQISPGPLSKVHEQLEGVSQCGECHEQGKTITGDLCLKCHAVVRESKTGFHNRHLNESCVSCHKEHLGKEAAITLFNPSEFDHSKTGFSIGGGHSKVKCEGCHKEANIRSDSVRAFLKKYPKKTYLGLSTACIGCHVDRHAGTLGNRCETCHQSTAWAPAASFSHASTKYKLSGKHEKVQCRLCHESLKQKNPKKPLVFKIENYADCNGCHKSLHSAKLNQQRCALCHVQEGWRVTTSFDHRLTAYPLNGKHVDIRCDKCHIRRNKKSDKKFIDLATATFTDCSPCHKSKHSAAFAQKRCSSCHTELGWLAESKQPFDHSITAFPLKEKHAAVQCVKCHGAGQHQILHPSVKCASCHKDPHDGVFAEHYVNACDRCHTEKSFKGSLYTIKEHQTGRFKLKGAHVAIPCRGCHVRKDSLMFKFPDMSCNSCHPDRHQGAFAQLMRERGCEFCHSVVSWNTVRFDHGTTEFALVGKHTNVRCTGCHKPTTKPGVVLYKGTPKYCAECHNDVHASQFAAEGKTECVLCHTPNGWHSVIFQHDTQSRFPLTGAHKKIACNACHKIEERDGVKFVRYKPLPIVCESCHQRK
jgi:hypothetical protein